MIGRMKRKDALEWIRIKCAQTGRIDEHALRIYTENRISYQAFIAAANVGIKQHAAMKAKASA